MMLVDANKNVSKLLRLRILRYRQTPMLPKRVKAHAIRRKPSTLLLQHSSILAIFRIQDQADASQYVCYISTVMLPYAVLF
jgi:hypothetical protein